MDSRRERVSSLLSRKKGKVKAKQVVALTKVEQKQEQPPPIQVPPPQERILIDSYPVREPFVRVVISQELDGSNKYVVVEPRLTIKERSQLDELKEALKNGLDLDVSKFDPSQAVGYLSTQTEEIMKKFGISIPPSSYEKIFYFIERDFLHYGKIDPIMRDPNIEDISCSGPELPLYVFHRTYESIRTNVSFKTQDELEKFVLRLAYMSGKHISVAEPVVDASLPEGSRIQMTFGTEITKKGSSFTIRKFKADPYSIIDLIRFGTVNAVISALMWYALENKSSVLLAGGTASGKSIAGSEPVLVYEQGSPRLMRISELFDRMAASHEVRKEGGYEIVDSSGLETAAFDSNLKVQRFGVKGVVRHPAPPRLFRLKTRTGREALVTGDHSVFTLVDGRVQPYPVSSIEPGMFLAVPRIVPDAAWGAEKLNLLEALAKEDYGLYAEDVAPYVRKAIEVIGKKRVGEILGLKPRSLKETLRLRSVPARVSKLNDLAHAAKMELDPEKLSIRARNYRRGRIPALVPISRELMRLIGYWVSEGMYGKGLKIFALDRRVRRDVSRVTMEAFGLEARYQRSDRTRIDISSRPLEVLFRHVLGLEAGSGYKRIPQLVLGQPNNLLAEFLRGYYTGDGTADKSVEAVTKSKVLAQQLLYALSRFGIVAQTNPKVIKNRTYHRVMIYGRKNIERFSESIGFLNHNQKNLEVYLSRRAPAHTNVDVIPGIAPLLKQCLQFTQGTDRKDIWSNWHSYWSTDKKIGQQALVSFVNRTGPQGEIRNRLLTVAYSELFWDEVVEVEAVECRDRYVYDLEVPGAQNFLGGSGGLFLHNTTTINCLALFIRPEAKIVTMEDTPEINLAHKNWIQSISRQGTAGMGEVTLYDLLRAALRQRPDFIIPGEVRGEEAQTMFQAISTGHAGMSSIHADSIAAVFNRLTNPPMSIPKTLLPALNFVLLQGRVTLKGRPARRILSVTEVVGLDPRTNELILNELYRYDFEKDQYVYSGRSYNLEKLAKTKGMSLEEVRQELATRRQVLQWMADGGMRRYKDVANVVQRYYTDRASLLAEMGGIAA